MNQIIPGRICVEILPENMAANQPPDKNNAEYNRIFLHSSEMFCPKLLKNQDTNFSNAQRLKWKDLNRAILSGK